MTQVMMYRGKNGHLIPYDDEARDYLQRLRKHELVLCSLRKPRNPGLHKKFFAMLAFAFDHWDPPEQMYGGTVVEKDRETFRKELTIAAGYYDVVLGLDGKTRLEAKSIAWANMDGEEFEKLYEAAVRVLAKGFLPGVTPELMDQWANQYREAA